LRQFEVMRDIAISSYSGQQPADSANQALRKVSEIVGLAAGTLVLWDDKNKPVLSVSHADDEEDRQLLDNLENELFENLRKQRNLVSAYMSFGGKNPLASFTLPIKRGERIFGAVIGIQKGSGSLISEDIFLEALAAALSMAFVIGQIEDTTEREKLDVLLATATTVNHEINNPLQAILGIVQLLPKERPDMDEKLAQKLKVIEESALAIMKVTHKLMNISEIEYTNYISDTKMIKLPEDKDSS